MKKTCPFNYAGSKSVYAELFDIEQPVADLFGGGGGFWSNVKSNDVLVNDVCSPLVRFQKKIYESSDEEFESIISAIRTTTDSVRTKDDYEKLRSLFNESKNYISPTFSKEMKEKELRMQCSASCIEIFL